MPEGTAKNKLQRAIVQAKKISEDPLKPKDSDASASGFNIVDLVAQLKQNTKGYVFKYGGRAEKAEPVDTNTPKSDDDSDAEDKKQEQALALRMEQSASLKRKAAKTMEMLMSNCLQNAFLFWKGAHSRSPTLPDPHLFSLGDECRRQRRGRPKAAPGRGSGRRNGEAHGGPADGDGQGDRVGARQEERVGPERHRRSQGPELHRGAGPAAASTAAAAARRRSAAAAVAAAPAAAAVAAAAAYHRPM